MARGPTRTDPPIPRLTAVTVPDAAADEHDTAGGLAATEAVLRLRRSRVVAVAVAAALGVVVGVVALLGGVAERVGALTPVAPGALIRSGPFELTLTRATVQRKTSAATWEVRVAGTIASTGDTSLVPTTDESGFLFAKVSGTLQTSSAGSAELGDPDAFPSRSLVSPDLPPAPWTVEFTFTAEPGPEVMIGVFEQKFTTKYLFSDEKSWQTDRDASTTVLPLERLPDAAY